MTASIPVPDQLQSPIVLWVLLATGVVIVLITSMDKIDSKWSSFMSKHRRSKNDAADVRVQEQKEQIDYLMKELKKTREHRTSDNQNHSNAIQSIRNEMDEFQIRLRDKKAVMESLARHTWEWRRLHAAAGFPYQAPGTPTQPDGVRDILPRWDGDVPYEEES